MTAHKGLVTLAIAATSLLPQVALGADGVVASLTSQADNITNTVTATVDNVGNGNSLVNVSGNQVSANPAVCANVLSSGACTATATQNSTNTSGVGANTGNNGIANGNSLVNVSGNQVNVNPAVCANVLSDGNCEATADQTTNNTSTVGGNGTGGGVLGASTDGAGIGGGNLPRAGVTALALILSLMGSVASAGFAGRKNLA